MIKDYFRLAVAQLNPIVGDIAGNLAMAKNAYKKAKSENADILLMSELFISAYPPEDLVLKPAFTDACEQAIMELAKVTQDETLGILIGTPLRRKDQIYNAVVLLADGKIFAERYKFDLPNYGEFDEKRVFTAGKQPQVLSFRGLTFGVPICEDIWNDTTVCQRLAAQGAEFIFVPNGSPFIRKKPQHRIDVVRQQGEGAHIPIIYANQIGGQDELVFDGGSFAIHGDGSIAFQMKHFAEELLISNWQRKDNQWLCMNGSKNTLLEGVAADYHACVLGFRDYVQKNRFNDVVLGMSGGIDSALCAAIAVDALGANHVRTIMLPYHYTSHESLSDAEECAHLLGCSYENVPISAPVEGFMQALHPLFSGMKQDITEENQQSTACTAL